MIFEISTISAPSNFSTYYSKIDSNYYQMIANAFRVAIKRLMMIFIWLVKIKRKSN